MGEREDGGGGGDDIFRQGWSAGLRKSMSKDALSGTTWHWTVEDHEFCLMGHRLRLCA